uniref:Distal membrane-arm assembly complex protein 1-like domain-containing protein n=1 Tax=Pelusios castaneus TaxID=367368 RepID=A0A8C8RT68_9SAUR
QNPELSASGRCCQADTKPDTSRANRTAVEAPKRPEKAASPHDPLSGGCWGCRALSGSALIGAGYWVYLGSRRVQARGTAPTLWSVVQVAFAGVLACLGGIVLLVDPAEKQKRKYP